MSHAQGANIRVGKDGGTHGSFVESDNLTVASVVVDSPRCFSTPARQRPPAASLPCKPPTPRPILA